MLWKHKEAKGTCQKSPDLIEPPFNTQHDHAGDGQADVQVPVPKALSRPACVISQLKLVN